MAHGSHGHGSGGAHGGGHRHGHEIRPAGAAESGPHHGHTIVPFGVLASVFAALLFFTLLTVAAAEAEKAIAAAFQITIPAIVNVLVALSIATVKTVLVVSIFMQLRYDSPINTMVLLFTFATVLFFFSFTMIDLGNRGTLYRYKAEHIQAGGTGVAVEGGLNTGGKPITVYRALEAQNPESPLHAILQRAKEKEKKKGGHGHGEVVHSGSSAEASRPVRGLTLPGFAPEGGAHEGHGESHGSAPAKDAKPAGGGH